jgi:hypothetical protein
MLAAPGSEIEGQERSNIERRIRLNGFLDGWIDGKSLPLNYFSVAKNIFKKVAKIPPGELQECAAMIKEVGETEIISCCQ